MTLRIPICTGGLIAFTAIAGCGGAENNPGGGGTAGCGRHNGRGAQAGARRVAPSEPAARAWAWAELAQGFMAVTETPSTIAADTTSALGFSANDVLAIAGGAHPSDLARSCPISMRRIRARRPRRRSRSPSRHSPQRCASSTTRAAGARAAELRSLAPVCPKRMEIDIGLTLVTGDGALNEELKVTLLATSKEAPAFKIDIDAAAVVGKYLEGVTPKQGYQLQGLHAEGGYGVSFAGSRMTVPNAWNGFVAALLTASGAPSTSTIMQAHGYFPRQTAGIK